MSNTGKIARFGVIRLLKKYCDDRLIEGICGDLEELYEIESSQYGSGKAKRKLYWRALGFYRQSFKRKRERYPTRFEALLRNYVKMTFRNGKRNRTSAVINIMGLTFGLTACVFLGQYVYTEWQHDKHFDDHERIYRLSLEMEFGDDLTSTAVSPSGLGKKAKEQIKFVENYAILRRFSNFKFRKDNELIETAFIFSANPGWNEVLNFQWLEGNSATALVEPRSIVLTERFALRIFLTSKNLLGRSITQDNGDIYTVTGIIKTPPKTSHIHPEAFISLGNAQLVDQMDIWRYCTYVKVDKRTPLDQFESAFDAFSLALFKEKGGNGRGRIFIRPQALADIHFTSKLAFEMEPNDGNTRYLTGFCVLIVVLLFMSVINYINLTTAQVGQRFKEIAVKRTFGAFTADLRLQFLVETAIYVSLSLVFSILLVAALQSSFESFANLDFPWHDMANLQSVVFIAGSIIVFTLLLGLYPSLYLSNFRPIKSNSASLARFRSVMLFLQLGLSMVVITCTTVFFAQMNFMSNQSLGYQKDQVLFIGLNQEQQEKVYPLMDALKTLTSVEQVASSYHVPGNPPPINNFGYESKDGSKIIVCPQIYVDNGFLETLDISILAGNNFIEHRLDDGKKIGVLINESFMNKAGWTLDNAVGQQLKSGTSWEDRVIGVVPDFHFTSLHHAIAPMVVRPIAGGHNLLIKAKTTDYRELIGDIENEWKGMFGNGNVDFKFLDQHFQAQYETDEKRAQLFAIFSFLIIFIALSGLFGMTTYAVQRRMKEMSIRKIHGASIKQILFLMTKAYGISGTIASIVGGVLSYILMAHWLTDFAYSIDLNAFLIAMPAVLLILLVLVIAGAKSAKLAFVNPSEILRNE
ncbi:MAG: putative ABC transport system permease protein [Cyclobacteriaceae bacterium]|jgi:putative ABC transport system permease protein